MFINVCLKERITSDSSVLGKKQNIKMADTAEGVLYDPVRVEFESKQNYPQVPVREQWRAGDQLAEKGHQGNLLDNRDTLISGYE